METENTIPADFRVVTDIIYCGGIYHEIQKKKKKKKKKKININI